MTFDLMPAMTTHHQLIHLPTVSVMTTTTAKDFNTYHNNQADIDSDIRRFWDSFPCPPPWRPSLLSEVNTSKLGPRIGESVKNFLVGKCQLQSVFPAIHLQPGWDDGGFDSSGGDDHLTTNSSSEHTWCNKTCQLAIGCSGVFVAMVIVILALVCLNRSRSSNKMPSTRPSRQQLQMSTSTSDPVNWAEFSNTQAQFDEDMIYPPFRHRDLPSPPSQCHHPSCDPKWNCQNGFTFHPLMRMSPSTTTYCTHGYTAVYEKIDDEDDEVDDRVPCNHARAFGVGERTGNIHNNHRVMQSGVPYIPPAQSVSCGHREEETGFNGEGFPVSTLPRYFELEGTHPNISAPGSAPGEQRINATNLNRENDPAWNHQRNPQCLNSFQVHSAFLNNSTVCNQLCATCVASVVSNAPPPFLNSQRQNEFVPKGNTLNSIPTSSTTSTNLSGYHPPNTSSFRQFTYNPEFLPSINDSIPENEPPPYSDQGCDLRQRTTFKPISDDSTLFPNGNNLPISPTPDINNRCESQGHTCHMTQNGSPNGSPCRQWCPTCQQVPLLNGDKSEIPCASFRPKTLNLPWYPHTKYMRACSSDDNNGSSDKTPENNREEESTDNNNLETEVNARHNVKKFGGYLTPSSQSYHDQMWQNHDKERGQGMSGDRMVVKRHEEGEERREEDREESCDESPRHALSLHSHYFYKTSSA